MSKADNKIEEKVEETPATETPAAPEADPKLEEMRGNMMRALAEAENTRKRAAKEVEEANRYGVSSIAKDLISVLENLTRAIEAAPAEHKAHFEGVDLTRKELLNVFERRGIKRIDPQPGEKFDHNIHQAITQIEDPNFAPGAVVQVVQSGYIIHDRLLRPAMVAVAKAPPVPPKVDTTV